MKITIFTSNQFRHINLINSLSKISTECYAIIEGKTVFPGKVKDFFSNSKLMHNYFDCVTKAEKKFFQGNKFINGSVKAKFIKQGDLNFLKKNEIKESLNSDLFIVFGSSYIKGWLANYLIKKKAINIHMGLSPYYRGSSCNFWAIYDKRPELVGATIHHLSKGLDSGAILYHCLPDLNCKNVYEYTMSSVLCAHKSLFQMIKSKKIFKVKSIQQKKELEVSYTVNRDFRDSILRNFNKHKLYLLPKKKIIKEKLNNLNLKDPFKF